MATKKTQEAGPRAALAEAIESVEAARRDLDDAVGAEEQAAQRCWRLTEEIERLEAEEAASTSAGNALIAAHRTGGDIDVALLERPAKERAGQVATLKRELAFLRTARNEIGSTLPARRDTLQLLQLRLDGVVRAAFASNFDIPALLDATARMQEAVAKRRVLLHFLQATLPDGDGRTAVAQFLRTSWLRGEFDGSWRSDPSLRPLQDLLASLGSDASALAPPLPQI